MSRWITAKEFAGALETAGIVPDAGEAHRIVIDCKADDVVRIYVDRFGDDRLLKLAQDLYGVEATELSDDLKDWLRKREER